MKGIWSRSRIRNHRESLPNTFQVHAHSSKCYHHHFKTEQHYEHCFPDKIYALLFNLNNVHSFRVTHLFLFNTCFLTITNFVYALNVFFKNSLFFTNHYSFRIFCIWMYVKLRRDRHVFQNFRIFPRCFASWRKRPNRQDSSLPHFDLNQ